MELPELSRSLAYVVAFSNKEFLEFSQQHPQFDCIFVVDETTLRGRVYAPIYYAGQHTDRWNWPGIHDSIDDFNKIHKQKGSGRIDDESEKNVEYGGFD
jgi:hypothetical protein